MNDHSPLVSIIVPLHNKENWIVDTLRSIANQAYTFWECIIVNDGSTDSSLRLVEEYTKHNQGNWRIFDVPQSGQARARNFGLGKALGVYCAFLDGDDLWPQQKLSEQIEIALEYDADLVLGPYLIFKNHHCLSFVKHSNIESLTRGWLGLYGFGGALESGGLMKTSTLKALQFDEKYSITSGLDLFLRFATGYKIKYCDSISLLYRISEQQEHRNISLIHSEMNQIIQNQVFFKRRFLNYNLSLFANFPRKGSNFIKLAYVVLRIFKNPFMATSFFVLTFNRKLLGRIRLLLHFKYLNTVFRSRY